MLETNKHMVTVRGIDVQFHERENSHSHALQRLPGIADTLDW